MLRPATFFAILVAASPAAALSVSSSACNGESAELVSTDAGTTLTVNGAEVPLDRGFEYEDLLCVGRDGETLFGLIGMSGQGEEAYFILDPRRPEMTRIDAAEAEALEFWEDEDDWNLDFDS